MSVLSWLCVRKRWDFSLFESLILRSPQWLKNLVNSASILAIHGHNLAIRGHNLAFRERSFLIHMHGFSDFLFFFCQHLGGGPYHVHC